MRSFAQNRYHIALIDLGLPGIPGDTISKELKLADPAIVTVLITGWVLDDDDPRLDSFDFRVQKPLVRDDLLDVIAQAPHLRRTRSGSTLPNTTDPADRA